MLTSLLLNPCSYFGPTIAGVSTIAGPPAAANVLAVNLYVCLISRMYVVRSNECMLKCTSTCTMYIVQVCALHVWDIFDTFWQLTCSRQWIFCRKHRTDGPAAHHPAPQPSASWNITTRRVRWMQRVLQCCGSGSGNRCLFDPLEEIQEFVRLQSPMNKM
jgi:hypothetical protein